jgi:hypothetical protein
MTREGFKSAGLQALLSVAERIDEIWPLLAAPGTFRADAIWQDRP